MLDSDTSLNEGHHWTFFKHGCLNFWPLVGYDTIPMLKLKATNKQEKYILNLKKKKNGGLLCGLMHSWTTQKMFSFTICTTTRTKKNWFVK